MNIEEFVCLPPKSLPESGSAFWQAPSNIALVKYWGKTGVQIPANPSLSFTLNACQTQTRVHFTLQESEKNFPEFEVYLDGVHAPAFSPKIKAFLGYAVALQPFLKAYRLEIHTSNTFPHSSGIASSASGMAALACCLMDMELQLFPHLSLKYFNRKTSILARLGSGSAARSIEGGLILWGLHPEFKGSSDLYGIPFPGPVAPIFMDYRDTILLVDKGEKSVSSTVGHGLMNGHPYAKARFNQANNNLLALGKILESGDVMAFVDLVETEALSLHAMMQSSTPGYLLMKPETLAIISQIRAFRNETGIPVCFTLDAGANVHVLYPKSVSEPVNAFIMEQLLKYCADGGYIQDCVGKGASKI
ncbi:MAG: hypothetical protein RLZZ241_1433 [Bacteroidota bacterium]